MNAYVRFILNLRTNEHVSTAHRIGYPRMTEESFLLSLIFHSPAFLLISPAFPPPTLLLAHSSLTCALPTQFLQFPSVERPFIFLFNVLALLSGIIFLLVSGTSICSMFNEPLPRALLSAAAAGIEGWIVCVSLLILFHFNSFYCHFIFINL